MIIPSDDRVTLDETAELKSDLMKAGPSGEERVEWHKRGIAEEFLPVTANGCILLNL